MRSQKYWDKILSNHTKYCPLKKDVCRWVGDKKNSFKPNICIKADKPLTEVDICLGFEQFLYD